MCWVRLVSTVFDYVSRSPGVHVSQLLLYEAEKYFNVDKKYFHFFIHSIHRW